MPRKKVNIALWFEVWFVLVGFWLLNQTKDKIRKKHEIKKVLISQFCLEAKGVKEQVEEIIFPLLREAKIKTIQIARKSRVNKKLNKNSEK